MDFKIAGMPRLWRNILVKRTSRTGQVTVDMFSRTRNTPVALEAVYCHRTSICLLIRFKSLGIELKYGANGAGQAGNYSL